MSADPAADQRAAIRRSLGWVLIAALCVAAFVAIVAIVSGDFDETDARLIGMSLGFAVFSATGATGATLRLSQSERLRSLGSVTVVVSGTSFALLVTALWVDNSNSDTLWKWWGAAALAAFACSHAALVAGAFREIDSPAVRGVGLSSIALATLDSSIGILGIAGAFDDVDASTAEFLAVLVILMLLTTVLTPIMRRLQRPVPAPPFPAPSSAGSPAPAAAAATPATLAAEVIAAADRIETLNADPGNRAPEIRREAERLRELARSYSR